MSSGGDQCSHIHRIEANERVFEARWNALEFRLGLIEALLGRLEKRFWMVVVGVASVVLTNAATSLLLSGN